MSGKIALPKCLSGNISERKSAFLGCEQCLVPEGDLSRWSLRRLKNPMISMAGFRTDTERIAGSAIQTDRPVGTRNNLHHNTSGDGFSNPLPFFCGRVDRPPAL